MTGPFTSCYSLTAEWPCRAYLGFPGSCGCPAGATVAPHARHWFSIPDVISPYLRVYYANASHDMYVYTTRYYVVVDVSTHRQAAVFVRFGRAARSYTLRRFRRPDGGAGGGRCFERESRIDNSSKTLTTQRIRTRVTRRGRRGGTVRNRNRKRRHAAVRRRRRPRIPCAMPRGVGSWGADWSYSALLSITTIYTGPIPVQHL